MTTMRYSEVKRLFGGFWQEHTLSFSEAAALEKEFAGNASPAAGGKMRQVYGDIWDLARGKALAVTTNGDLKKDGSAVMGRGIALQAARRFPGLPRRLGAYLRKYGNRCFYLGRWQDYTIVSFPTKRHWRENANLELIKVSAVQLVKIADKFNLPEIYLPRPGCGAGGLIWKDVDVVLRGILDERFVICAKRGDNLNAGLSPDRPGSV